MPVPVTVPRATITMERGTIVRWLKKAGDRVEQNETIFEMETDKALIEVPAPAAGQLLQILISSGEAPVDAVAAWIGKPGEALPEQVADGAAKTAILATPAARRRARELGVTLDSVTGTGPGGRITQEDVEAAAPARPEQRREGLERLVEQSWRSVPHIHICRCVDGDGLVAARARYREAGLEVTYTDLLLYATARVLPSFPALTTTWAGERRQTATDLPLAFAVDAGGTVLAPVIARATELSLQDLARRRRELTESARAGRLHSGVNAVFTLTNLGMHGADLFAPVIRLPETAMLAVGRIAETAVVKDGALAVGWRFWANLAADHRVTDGAQAAQFLSELERFLSALPGGEN